MDSARRFSGTARLYGAPAVSRFAAAHVCVVGIGGVGSWAAEALARSAIGHITLIDLDHVVESNVNRQIHAIEGQFGRSKVQAMAARIHAINPVCEVSGIEAFIAEDNVGELLPACDAVIDAIDNVRAKAALIGHCGGIGRLMVTTGGAGGRRNPALIEVDDLARTHDDRLAAKVRAKLRKDYGFSRDTKQKFGVDCIFSRETITRPATAASSSNVASRGFVGLNCAGYGSSVAVTATFGLVAAAWVLERLA